MKKKWQKPKLIVLFRGKPEEGVLQNCKDGVSSSGSDNYNQACYIPACVCSIPCDTLGS